jgi:iron(III) transport system permease protein
MVREDDGQTRIVRDLEVRAGSPAPTRRSTWQWQSATVALAIALFLFAFLVYPVLKVMHVAFTNPDGSLTLGHFAAFAQLGLMREAFINSMIVGFGAVALSTVIAAPLAYLTARFDFRGAVLVQTLGVVPLIMPAFVGATAMQLLFGKSGSLNLVLNDWFGFTLPIMEGLWGVILVEGLHYFPFILLNLTAALSQIDRAMEESAQNLGASGFRLFRRIVFPLAMPGYVAGASLVFAKVFDDVGTPLMMSVTNMLAPQAYLRITSVGVEDPIGYVVSVVMVVISVAAIAVPALIMRGKDYATIQKGGGGLARRTLGKGESVLAYLGIVVVLLFVLSPHIGLLLLSFSKVWSFSVLPDAYTLENYQSVMANSGHMIGNTLLYCGLAALIDVIVGGAIAYIVLRTKVPGRQWLDWTASAALAIPGIVLAIGYLRTFKGVELPFGMGAATASWLLIMIAYAIRRLPYAIRACMAALQQVHVSLEEVATSLGATPRRTVLRIVAPLMIGGIMAGFVTSFITAAVELSATILLVSADSSAPMSYGIYLYMQSVAGRGPGAALGVLAVVLVAVGTYFSNRFLRNRSEAAGPEGTAAALR